MANDKNYKVVCDTHTIPVRNSMCGEAWVAISSTNIANATITGGMGPGETFLAIINRAPIGKAALDPNVAMALENLK